MTSRATGTAELLQPMASNLRDDPAAKTDSHDRTTSSSDELATVDAFWRAATTYRRADLPPSQPAASRDPLRSEHIKPRLLGHWGTSPGLSLLYAHLNRLIAKTDSNIIFLAGPGHGGPAVLASVYLEGTYSEIYPHVGLNTAGLARLFRQFSTPAGVPSHVGPSTPGSIHEGGELGYVLTHAFGAVFDNPDLIAVAVVGDGEAETGPLEDRRGISLNPARDGAVLPVLHLNGYKIAVPPFSVAVTTARSWTCWRPRLRRCLRRRRSA